MQRDCFCCEHLPKGQSVKNSWGGFSLKKGWWKNTPHCETCNLLPYGEEGCCWNISPIPLEELK